MLTTVTAAAVFVAAVLPGALYTWGFERQVGRWGIGLSDRLLRFAGVSAVFHAVLAPVTYWVVSDFVPRARDGTASAWALWALAMAYVALPLVGGTGAGRAVRGEHRWTEALVGAAPAPRGWDYLFSNRELDGWIRLQTKSGVWIGGAWARDDESGRQSYAAGYPDEQDLYLAVAVLVDADTGEFLIDEGGIPQATGGSLLIRWSEVEYLEFFDR
jgi:uncharacterized protein DUF6338